MEIITSTIETNGATEGTLSHPKIYTSSKVLFGIQVSESEDIAPLFAGAVGLPRAGEQDWKMNQGHDNPVSLPYAIINGGNF